MSRSSVQCKQLSNEQLWQLYQQDKDIQIKQEIALRYTYVIKTIALQMKDVYSSFAQVEDIVQEGVIVLMSQIDKFDVSKNVKFETYLSRRIRGMIIDIARKQDWGSRNVRKNMKSIEAAVSHLTEQTGQMPDPKTVAEYLDIPYDKYCEIVRKNDQMSVVSLDMVLEQAQEKQNIKLPQAKKEDQPEESLEKKELLYILKNGIDRLKEKEKIIISLYYVEELNMKEIAKVMDISEPRVSQIHSAAIKKLKEYIQSQF